MLAACGASADLPTPGPAAAPTGLGVGGGQVCTQALQSLGDRQGAAQHLKGPHTPGSCCHILQPLEGCVRGGVQPLYPQLDAAGWAPMVRAAAGTGRIPSRARQDPQRAKVWAGKGAALPDESARRERGFLGLRWGLGLFFLQREESWNLSPAFGTGWDGEMPRGQTQGGPPAPADLAWQSPARLGNHPPEKRRRRQNP